MDIQKSFFSYCLKFICLAYLSLFFLSSCSVNPTLDSKEYQVIHQDLQSERSFPVLRKAIDVRYLIKALDDRSHIVRYNAAHDLKALGKAAKDARTPLIEKYSDTNTSVANMSFAAVSNIGLPKEAIENDTSWSNNSKEQTILPSLEKHLSRSSANAATKALKSLTMMEAGALASVPKVISMLGKRDSAVTHEARRFLIKMPADINPLLRKALNSGNDNKKSSVMITLARRGDRNSIPEIENFLNKSSSSLRLQAAKSLAILGGSNREQEVGQVLSSYLRSARSEEKKEISALLRNLGLGNVVSSYKMSQKKAKSQKLRSQKKNSEQRASTAAKRVRQKLRNARESKALRKNKTKENIQKAKLILPVLERSLSVGSYDQKIASIKSLGKMGTYYTPAVDVLIEALTNPAVYVKGRAALALGNLRDERAVGALILMLDDENSEVKDAAIGSLTQISTPNSLRALSHIPAKERAASVKRALRESGGTVTPLVQCSEARSLCRMFLQSGDSSAGSSINEEAKICAWKVQPGC